MISMDVNGPAGMAPQAQQQHQQQMHPNAQMMHMAATGAGLDDSKKKSESHRRPVFSFVKFPFTCRRGAVSVRQYRAHFLVLDIPGAAS